MKTIAKSLKEKNKLKLEISQLQKRLNTHNSVIIGNKRPFDLTQVETEMNEKISQLVILKSAITKANQQVQEKIYKIAEIKGLIAFYKKLPVDEGKKTADFRSESFDYEVFFNEAIIAEKIKKLESEAEKIQDELESFNHITNI
ncbi:MAG: hypothetical protein A2046_12270 [Bacteroidetes bacterium GWA2_30_7]|nr:MAG: hypothetical protein A2046_12270 [Bacteroidetes bacterium GWA2_30_7]